jgi:GEVED domain/Secretion system C-terminal sorting domain
MKKLLLTFSTLFLFTLSFGQYCTIAGPSSTADSNVESVQITGDASAIAHTGCPGVVGVQDLTSSGLLSLTPGNSYTISVQFGTCGGNFSGAGSVWIDYDGNFSFDPTEVIGTWQGIPPVSLSVFNFTVPIIATPGFTRMRVMQQEDGILPLNPCASFTWGSIMDFSVSLGSNTACAGYDGDTKADAIPIPSVPYATTGATDYCYFNQNLVYASPDIYYRLITDATMNNIDVSLCGSNFDTFLSVVDPQGNVIEFNDDGSCGNASEISFSTIGHDTVYLIIEGWNLSSGDFTLNINKNATSINEFQTARFSVFPNPFSENFTIDSPNEFDEVVVRDLTGKIVYRSTQIEKEISPLQTLEKGIYLLELKTNSQSLGVKQIIKQ